LPGFFYAIIRFQHKMIHGGLARGMDQQVREKIALPQILQSGLVGDGVSQIHLLGLHPLGTRRPAGPAKDFPIVL
jgi:hypothetical protein